MTKVITRYFESTTAARAARKELLFVRRFSKRIVDLIEEAEGADTRLIREGVIPETAKAYKERLAKGGAVLMVKAGYKPLSAAQTARDVAAEKGAVDMGELVEDVLVLEEERRGLSVLSDHPYMLTTPRDPDDGNHYMANWPIPLISRRKPFAMTVFPRHARMANFPIPLISKRKPYDGFAFPRHKRMADFPIPLISKRVPADKFAFPRHARMANFPIPLISKRKPYTGSLIPRHQRMATWPFPLLINGKTGTNALMPGGPRMANFPIPLISKREPSDAFAFPRHARMANFPIPLISKRKPSDKFAFPRHARMADMFLPLVIRKKEKAEADPVQKASLSGMLGLPTVIRR